MNCQCGCGQVAPISERNRKRDGWIKGQPKRFVTGHNLFKFQVKGELHQLWKGGVVKRGGYIYVRADGHPKATRSGYVKRATLIAEKALGQFLRKGEEVHHFNEIKHDDSNTNLIICTKSYHAWLHTHGQANPMAKLVASQILAIRESSKKATQLAKDYNLGVSTIYEIRARERWKHL